MQWNRWHQDALDGGVAEPNAMTVATIGADGIPDARIVLVREADQRGLVFYTNYASAKSRQLDQAPVAAAVFSWLDLHRQVRVRGRVERVNDAESDAYFASRPRASQLGAWASPQSEVIEIAPLSRHWSSRATRSSPTVTSPARRTGVAGGSSRSSGSSGRAAPAASTIVCAIDAPTPTARGPITRLAP